MTLIAAFRCVEDEFVLCADSQETVGGYRIARQKITAEQWGHFNVSIAGTGHGELIDGCVSRLADAVKASEVSTLDELRQLIRQELLDFNKNEGTQFPQKDRNPRFIIAAQSPESASVQVWKTAASRLIPVDSYAMVGWEEPMYEHVVHRLYRQPLTLVQGVILGAYVLTLAGETSNYVGGQTSVVIARKNGIAPDLAENVSDLVDRLKLFGDVLDRLLLACPDTSITTEQFRAELVSAEAAIHDGRRYL